MVEWLLIIELWLKVYQRPNLSKLKNLTWAKTAVSLFKILLKNCPKQVHKDYPLAGPCICNYKLEFAFAIISTLSGPIVVFLFSFLILIVVEWFLNCDWRFTKGQTLPNLSKLKNLTLAGPCICNYKLEFAFAIISTLSGPIVVFLFSFLILIVVEWFLNCDWRFIIYVNATPMYLCIHVYIHVSMYLSMHLWVHPCIHVFIYASMYLCMHPCTYVIMYVYVSMYLCIYASMFLLTYLCI